MYRCAPGVAARHARRFHASVRCAGPQKPIIDIHQGTFYATPNEPIFPGLTFRLDSHNGNANPAAPALSIASPPQTWAVLSPSSRARTTLLQILAGRHVASPPTARIYPALADANTSPARALAYVGFDAERGSSVGGSSTRGAYLSARYESRREETDFDLRAYLLGQTELNAIDSDVDAKAHRLRALDDAVDLLDLHALLDMPVANLSNGQTRRARIARALMSDPAALLLDGPFMGLDPRSSARMQDVLTRLAGRARPSIVLSLRPEDGVPDWISDLIVVDEHMRVLAQGGKDTVFAQDVSRSARGIIDAARHGHKVTSTTRVSRDGFSQDAPALPAGEAVVDMQGVRVAYGDKTVLGGWRQQVNGEDEAGLWWTLRRGQRCGIFGANGSGKTTLLSLITSDHPQTYSLPIKLFGRARLPAPGEPGISLFDIQQRMGHSSPEVHAFFPRQLSVRRALQSAWADAPMAKPKLTDEARGRVDACLRWFARELQPDTQQATALEVLEDAAGPNSASHPADAQLKVLGDTWERLVADGTDLAWADTTRFGELAFSSQRLTLFLRALVKSPELVILDEALSGVDEATRDRALLFLAHGETVAAVDNNDDAATKLQPSVLARLGAVRFAGLTPQQALLVISHSREDVPGCVREWICLPEPGEGRAMRTGTLDGPLELNERGWDEIWGR